MHKATTANEMEKERRILETATMKIAAEVFCKTKKHLKEMASKSEGEPIDK